MEKPKGNILIVDDDPSFLPLLLETLTEEGYFTVGAANGAEAISLLNLVKYNCIILDLDMPYVDGCELVKLIRDLALQTPIVMMSGLSYARQTALKLDIEAFLTKPFEIPVLLHVVDDCVTRSAPAAIKSARPAALAR